MPEMPEVETIRRDLEKEIKNEKIVTFEVKTASQFKSSKSAPKILKSLIGQKIVKFERIGKLLIFQLSDKQNYLLCHLRMTGQLILTNKSETKQNPKNKHTHIVINFENGKLLHFNDIRKFGYLQLCTLKEKNTIKEKFGIEPLSTNFNLQNFTKALGIRKAPIKNILLNQKLIAGIGNIYADEICFSAKINPQKPTSKLSKIEIKNLFNFTQKVIEKAIEQRGTSFSDYRDGKGNKGNYLKMLNVYGKSGKNCTICKTIISKIKLAGRGTHFCSKCQSTNW